jgi:hypothetical protein
MRNLILFLLDRFWIVAAFLPGLEIGQCLFESLHFLAPKRDSLDRRYGVDSAKTFVASRNGIQSTGIGADKTRFEIINGLQRVPLLIKTIDNDCGVRTGQSYDRDCL